MWHKLDSYFCILRCKPKKTQQVGISQNKFLPLCLNEEVLLQHYSTAKIRDKPESSAENQELFPVCVTT